MPFMKRRWPWTTSVPGPRRHESSPTGTAAGPVPEAAQSLPSTSDDLVGSIKSLSLAGAGRDQEVRLRALMGARPTATLTKLDQEMRWDHSRYFSPWEFGLGSVERRVSKINTAGVNKG